MPSLREGQSVYFQKNKNETWRQGRVVSKKERNYVVKSTEGTLYKRNREHVHLTEVEVMIRDNSPSRDYYSARNEDDAPPTVSNPPSGDPIV